MSKSRPDSQQADLAEVGVGGWGVVGTIVGPAALMVSILDEDECVVSEVGSVETGEADLGGEMPIDWPAGAVEALGINV